MKADSVAFIGTRFQPQERGSHANSNITSTRFLTLFFTFVAATGTLRYLWSLSLANGDELFFSNGAGTLNSSTASTLEWWNFITWLWWEHTGRTADFLSAFVYFWGISSGKWIASILASASSLLIVLCLERLHVQLYPSRSIPLIFIPFGVGTLLFLPAADTLLATANLTLYSAAVSNYLVPTALTLLAIRLVVVNPSLSRLITSSAIGGVTATMHEQSAAMHIVLVTVFLMTGCSSLTLRSRALASVFPLMGAAEMLFSPGLHNKLAKVALSQPATDGPSLLGKFSATFFGIGIYYPLVLTLISLVIVLSVLHKKSKTGYLVRVFLLLSILALLISVGSFFLHPSEVSLRAVSLSAFLLLTCWVLSALLDNSYAGRLGLLFLVLAATSLSIPAVSGLSAIRVFNFTMLFSIVFLIWNVLVLFSRGSLSMPTDYTHHLVRNTKRVLPFILVASMTIIGFGKTLIAFQENYDPGIAALRQQHAVCSAALCRAIDPSVPYQRAVSGYGNHDYADIERVLQWILTE